MFSSRSSGLSFGFLGLSVLSFVGAIAFVVYYSPVGTYVALGLVLVGSFMMVVSAMLRERSRVGSLPTKSPAVEDEETAFNS